MENAKQKERKNLNAVEAKTIASNSQAFSDAISRKIREQAHRGCIACFFTIAATLCEGTIKLALTRLVNEGYTVVAEMKTSLTNLTTSEDVDKFIATLKSDKLFEDDCLTEDIKLKITW